MSAPITETRRGPMAMVFPDGRRFTTEREVTSVDNWQDTPFGPVNFGYVLLGPTRMVELPPISPQPRSLRWWQRRLR